MVTCFWPSARSRTRGSSPERCSPVVEIAFDSGPAHGSGEPGTVVTVGTFDGVHLGHRAVLRALIDAARERGAPNLLVTFEPHPVSVVRPEAAPKLLTTPAERRELLSRSG